MEEHHAPGSPVNPPEKTGDAVKFKRFRPGRLNSIYYTDDYPREGCTVTVKVVGGKFFLRESAPNGLCMATYAPVSTAEAAGRMVSEWASGKAPSRFPDIAG